MTSHSGRKKDEHPWFHLMLLYLKRFYRDFRPYIWVTILFLVFYGIFYVRFSEPKAGNYAPTVLTLESIDVCEGFDQTTYKTIGCNHIFEYGIPGVSVFYFVSFNTTPEYNLTVKWYRNEELVKTGQNDFTHEGRPVDPGEYLLAMPSSFDLDVGNYTIELYEGPYFLGQVYYSIVPQR